MAGSFIDFVGATPQTGSAPAYAPLSGTSTAPSLLLSQCLVRVLLSLWSGFVAQVAPGAVAPVPEALVPHLCLPLLTLVSDLMVAILTLAASYSQAPLPTCSFFFSGVLPDPSAPSRPVFLSSVERGHSTLGGYRSRGLFVR